jgi:hypothetical protein
MGAVFVCARAKFSTAAVDAVWVSLWKSLIAAFGNSDLVQRDDVLTSTLLSATHLSTAIVDDVGVSLWTSPIQQFANKHLHHRVELLISYCAGKAT